MARRKGKHHAAHEAIHPEADGSHSAQVGRHKSAKGHHDPHENEYSIDTRGMMGGHTGKDEYAHEDFHEGNAAFGMPDGPWPGKGQCINEPGNGDDQHPSVM